MLPSNFPDKVRGLMYCLLWYISIMAGFYFLFAPLIPLVFLYRPLYRKITDILFITWEAFNVSMIQIFLGVNIFISGDPILTDESGLLILNHRTRVDWNFLWCALFHATSPGQGHNAKFILKDEIKKIPGIGWTMQMSRCLYISRNWKSDEAVMEKMLNHFASVRQENNPRKNFQLILFPEGTNLTKATKKKSDEFALKNNLKPLTHVLHPRTTGFSYITNKLRENEMLDALYDVTVAYPDTLPDREEDLSRGKIPKEVHFYIKRYSLKNIPNTYIGLEKWLQEMWRDKDTLLDNVYKGIRLPAHSSRQLQPQPISPLQYITLVAWFFFLNLVFTNLFSLTWTALYLWTWMILVTILMTTISEFTPGLQEVEILLETKQFWSKIWQSCRQFVTSRVTRKSVEKSD